MGERNIRIDNADSYDNLASVGTAMQESGVPRANIFLTSKTGSPFPLGYDDTMSQFAKFPRMKRYSPERMAAAISDATCAQLIAGARS